MDVHNQIGAVMVEQVLAVRLGAFEHPPVEEGGARREPALRARDGHRAACEPAAMQLGEPVEGVTFWHRG
jgi:hypothetical protein